MLGSIFRLDLSVEKRPPSSGLRPPSPARGEGMWCEDEVLSPSPARGEGTWCEDEVLSPLPMPGEVARIPRAGAERVRVASLAGSGAPSSGLRPPSPARGRRDVVRGRSVVTSPDAGRGRSDPAGGSRAGEGCESGRERCPLIRPSATFSRAGEKGRGARTKCCHLSRCRERSLGSRGREPSG